jgi:hypothetical protein
MSDVQGKEMQPKKDLRLKPRTRKVLAGALLILLVAYVGFAALVWWAMRQPPEQFGKVMSKMPGPAVFLLFPFETAWMRARAGTLQIGDPAPDFLLTSVDKSQRVQLSALNHQQPVVLVFGSYT